MTVKHGRNETEAHVVHSKENDRNGGKKSITKISVAKLHDLLSGMISLRSQCNYIFSKIPILCKYCTMVSVTKQLSANILDEAGLT